MTKQGTVVLEDLAAEANQHLEVVLDQTPGLADRLTAVLEQTLGLAAAVVVARVVLVAILLLDKVAASAVPEQDRTLEVEADLIEEQALEAMSIGLPVVSDRLASEQDPTRLAVDLDKATISIRGDLETAALEDHNLEVPVRVKDFRLMDSVGRTTRRLLHRTLMMTAMSQRAKHSNSANLKS
jgi:hypothetical protein